MGFITEEVATALGQGTVRIAVFVFIDIDGDPLRLWFGNGDYPVPPSAIDPAGGIYKPLPPLAGLPVLSQLLNGEADRVEFSISGVSAEAIALADEDAETVLGAPVHMGLTGLDQDWQPLSDPIWIWEGEADSPRFSWDTSTDADGVTSQTRIVGLSVGTALTGRRRPKIRIFSGVEQRRRSADDRFCDRAPTYSRGSTRKWP